MLPIYVDPVNGDDEANDGKTWETALKTIAAASAKTELAAYHSERRCQIILKKGTYSIDTKIDLMPRASLMGDPSCDRSEVVLTAPEGTVITNSLITFNGIRNSDYVSTIANLTISNITISSQAAIQCGSATHDRYSEVISNVVFTLCRQINGSSVSAVALYADGQTYVTDCLFSGLTNTTAYGTVAVCRNGGWFRNCTVENCSNGGYGQIYVWSSPEWDKVTEYSGIENCTFTNNYARYSGGCYFNMPTVLNSRFYDNVCERGAGSVGSYTDPPQGCFTNRSPRVEGCVFERNVSMGMNNNGGVLSFECGGIVSNCTFVGNVATGACGAVANAMDVMDCTFTSNVSKRASYGGGACFFEKNAYVGWRTPRISECVFTGNRTENTGACGGAVCARYPMAVEDCTFTGNAAYRGGAVASEAANAAAGVAGGTNLTVTVRRCEFTGNSGTAADHSIPIGGAVYANAPMDIECCRFFTNTAYRGGAVASATTNLAMSVRHCRFEGNAAMDNAQAYGAGGAVCDVPTVRDCTFEGNSASDGGGLFWGAVKSGVVSNCTFSGNGSASRGGGVAVSQYSKLSNALVMDCVFTNNMAGGTGNYMGGGGMYLWIEDGAADVGLTLRNCLFAGNVLTNETASSCGSAAILMSRKGTARILVENCTMVANRSMYGNRGALYVWPDNVGYGAGHTYVTNTVIALNLGADGVTYAPPYDSVYGLQPGMAEKVGYSYFHPKSSGWGATWTDGQHIENSDTPPTFKMGGWIPKDSSLRDAGLVMDWMIGASDLRRDGNGLPVGPRVYGASVDIGAYEYSPANKGFCIVVK